MSKHERHYCPSCGAGLVAEPIGTSLRCKNCNWRLITRAEWQTLPPFRQGYAMYMQASWPTSELADVKNPYAKDSSEWTAFRQGEQRAVLDAQDGEE
jgi:DNA-directed RNA polymerase subunit RPC12/RpoP